MMQRRRRRRRRGRATMEKGKLASASAVLRAQLLHGSAAASAQVQFIPFEFVCDVGMRACKHHLCFCFCHCHFHFHFSPDFSTCRLGFGARNLLPARSLARSLPSFRAGGNLTPGWRVPDKCGAHAAPESRLEIGIAGFSSRLEARRRPLRLRPSQRTTNRLRRQQVSEAATLARDARASFSCGSRAHSPQMVNWLHLITSQPTTTALRRRRVR